MKQAILVSLGWVAVSAGLYVLLVILELYWNLYEWQPKPDLKGVSVILGILLLILVIHLLAGATRHPVSWAFAILTSVALLSLAIYVFPPEPLTQGVFAREHTSPIWYRAGRFLLLSTPAAFLLCRLFVSRKRSGSRLGRRGGCA